MKFQGLCITFKAIIAPMKKTLLLFVAIFTLGMVQAQDGFEADPEKVDTFFDSSTPDIVGHGNVCNTGNDTICLYWRIVDVSVPFGWTAYMCDANLCYGPGDYECPEENPVCLPPGECGILDLHLLPGANPECGRFKVVVWEKGDTTNFVEIPYNFNCATSSRNIASKADISVYPNPTSDYFQLDGTENIGHIVLHTLLGKQIRDYDARDGGSYDVSDLNNGMYVVNLFDKKNTLVKSLRLRKE